MFFLSITTPSLRPSGTGSLFCIGIPALKRRACLARLERSCSSELGNEAAGALGAGGRKRSEDLPGTGTFLGFVTTGNFARDDRWAQLTFSQVVGGIDAIVIQEGKKMVALFIKAIAHGFFAGFAAGSLQ